MTKVQKYTYMLQILSIVFVLCMLVITCSRWFFDFVPSQLLGVYKNDPLPSLQNIPAMPLMHRIFGFLVDTIGFGIVLAGGISFYRLTKQFQKGEFFSPEIIHLLHILSRLALSWVIYDLLRTMLLSVITTLHKGPGNRILSVAFGTDDIANIFIFACFVLITALIQEGTKLKKEQDLTI